MSELIRGPVKVYQGGVEMGYVESDIELNDEPQFVEAKVTCFGEGVFDEMENGLILTLTVPFTALTNAALVKLGGTAEGTDVVFSASVGSLTRGQSEELILKPCIDQNASIDTKTWTTIYLAYPKRKFAAAYGATQRVWNVEYQAYASLNSGTFGRYYKIGENG